NEANATTPTQSAPATPSNLTASAASATEIDLAWTDNSVSPSAATSFQLYRSSDGINFDWFATTGQGVTSYTWNSASPSTAYYFYVTASNSNGASAPSNTASVTGMAVPAAPSNLTATARSSARVDLAWIDNSTSPALATSFKLYRSTDQTKWKWFATPGQGVTS